MAFPKHVATANLLACIGLTPLFVRRAGWGGAREAEHSLQSSLSLSPSAENDWQAGGMSLNGGLMNTTVVFGTRFMELASDLRVPMATVNVGFTVPGGIVSSRPSARRIHVL